MKKHEEWGLGTCLLLGQKDSPQPDRPDGIQDISPQISKKRDIEIPGHGLHAVHSGEYPRNTDQTNGHERAYDNPQHERVVRQCVATQQGITKRRQPQADQGVTNSRIPASQDKVCVAVNDQDRADDGKERADHCKGESNPTHQW